MPYSQQKVIQCWYDVLSDMVKTLRHEADATVALTFRVENQVNDLECGGWRGRGAESFFVEMREVVLPAMRKLEDALEYASEQLVTIIRIFSRRRTPRRRSNG
ncbi:MAG: WXG100 family type VII secretion target [Anaerolineae bacterium]|nr:WXG100 family type VII secretion target [Anaerolineae bacterium]